MQRLLFFLLFWSLACPASAKNLEFGSSGQLFSVSVPEQWTEKKLDQGLQIISPDSSASICMTVVPNEELPFPMFHQIVPSRLHLNDVKKKEGKDQILITGQRDGAVLVIELRLENDWLISVVGVGVERKVFEPFSKSLTFLSDQDDTTQ